MDKALSFNNKLKWGFAVLAIPALALLGYIAFHVILGLTVLFALAGSAVAAAIGYALLPALTERLTQLKFQAFKATVAKFPIESLEGDIQRGEKHLKNAYAALEEKKTIVESFRLDVKQMEAEHPEDVVEAKEQLAMAEDEMAFHVQDYLELENRQEALVKTTEKLRRRWKIAQAGAKLREALVIKDKFMSEMRQDAAIQAVQEAQAASIAHMKLSRDVEYMRKRIQEAKAKDAAPAALVYDTSGNVVLPAVKHIDYTEVVERKAA